MHPVVRLSSLRVAVACTFESNFTPNLHRDCLTSIPSMNRSVDRLAGGPAARALRWGKWLRCWQAASEREASVSHTTIVVASYFLTVLSHR